MRHLFESRDSACLRMTPETEIVWLKWKSWICTSFGSFILGSETFETQNEESCLYCFLILLLRRQAFYESSLSNVDQAIVSLGAELKRCLPAADPAISTSALFHCQPKLMIRSFSTSARRQWSV